LMIIGNQNASCGLLLSHRRSPEKVFEKWPVEMREVRNCNPPPLAAGWKRGIHAKQNISKTSRD
jgi:hypothetical protein